MRRGRLIAHCLTMATMCACTPVASAVAVRAPPSVVAPLSHPIERATLDRYLRVWESGDVTQLPSILAPSYVGITANGKRDAAGLKARIQAFRTTYREAHFTIIEQLAEGDRLATRLRCEAFDASGRPVRLNGINVSRFSEGRISEELAVWELVAQ